MKPKHADDGSTCPLWRKPCVKVCHTCKMWEAIRGKHPQTGADMDHWDCTFKMQTVLALENARVTQQATATLDALRKEVAESHDVAMVGAIQRLNRQFDAAQQAALANGSSPQKLIEG